MTISCKIFSFFWLSLCSWPSCYWWISFCFDPRSRELQTVHGYHRSRHTSLKVGSSQGSVPLMQAVKFNSLLLDVSLMKDPIFHQTGPVTFRLAHFFSNQSWHRRKTNQHKSEMIGQPQTNALFVVKATRMLVKTLDHWNYAIRCGSLLLASRTSPESLDQVQFT